MPPKTETVGAACSDEGRVETVSLGVDRSQPLEGPGGQVGYRIRSRQKRKPPKGF